MRQINQYKFKRLLERQNNQCYYCLKKFSSIRSSDNTIRKVTVDHVVPRSELKDKTYLEQNTKNTVLACLDCNRRKMNISAELFLEGYEGINISPYDEPSMILAVKTRAKRRWYHYFLTW